MLKDYLTLVKKLTYDTLRSYYNLGHPVSVRVTARTRLLIYLKNKMMNGFHHHILHMNLLIGRNCCMTPDTE